MRSREEVTHRLAPCLLMLLLAAALAVAGGGCTETGMLFDDRVVHRIDLTIDASLHQQMMEDLEDKLGGGGPGGAVGTPIWVPVTFSFKGRSWRQVGMRYKGNSSLKGAWQTGVRKLAFRLTFDYYELQHPETTNQRFYGFKKMIFSNAYRDPSLIRDKLAADIFRAAGVPAVRTSFARVFVDHGKGPVYFGLYTMTEDPADRMLGNQFCGDRGNLYKPTGEGGRLKEFIQSDLAKANNDVAADWSDVRRFIEALNSDRSNPSTWRKRLEAVFDVPGFLRYLAVNQTMVDWDSYGFAHTPQNYYLYADPCNGGRLTWIPWDLNLSMMRQTVGGKDPGSLSLSEVDGEWPLIRFLLDDPGYRGVYEQEIRRVAQGAFSLEAVHAKMDAYHSLIAPYVVGEQGEKVPHTFLNSPAEFEESLTAGKYPLKPHAAARQEAVKEALGI